MNAIEVVGDYLRSRIPGSDVAPLRDVLAFRGETLGFEVCHGQAVFTLEIAAELLGKRTPGEIRDDLDRANVVSVLVSHPAKVVVLTAEGFRVVEHSG